MRSLPGARSFCVNFNLIKGELKDNSYIYRRDCRQCLSHYLRVGVPLAVAVAVAVGVGVGAVGGRWSCKS